MYEIFINIDALIYSPLKMIDEIFVVLVIFYILKYLSNIVLHNDCKIMKPCIE